MLRFFSRIRKELLSDHKMSKYLLYALGEIVLVVIGILIALQINTWNENQKNREQELVILENILQDLKTDREGLLQIIERRKSKAASADVMVGYYDGAPIAQLPDYYWHWLNVLLWETHSPRDIAFKELVNAGNLSLIRNKAIKNGFTLASYNNLLLSGEMTGIVATVEQTIGLIEAEIAR